MLQSFRERIKGWIAVVIVGLLVIPFALWGVNSYFDFARETTLATVNGVEITPVRFQQRYQEQLARFQQMFGEQYRPEMFDNQRMREQVLDALVDEEVVRQRAAELKFRVGDQQLAAEIRKLEFFQAEGAFSPDLYRSLLSQQGMSPAQFEARVRADLVDAQLPSGIQGTEFVTDEELARYVALRDQQRAVRWTLVPVEMFIAGITLSDADLQAWYEANSARFMDPETVALEYLEFKPDASGADIEVTEEALRELYEQQADLHRSQEQRLARHILIPVEGEDVAAAEAKAAALVARLNAGEDFASLARAESQDPGSAADGGSLGWIERGVLVGPFEDALFSMETGQVQGPVRTEFGVHVIKLEEIKAEATKPFAEVRDALELEYLDSERERRYLETAERLTDLAYANPDSLEPAAEALGLSVQRVEGVTRDSGAGIAVEDRVREAAFSTDVLEEGRNSPPLELAPQHVVVVRVAERRPAQRRPFASVRDQVEDGARQEQAAARAQALAEQARERVQGGEPLATVARKLGLTEVRDARLTRQGGEVPPDLARAVFQAPLPTAETPSLGIAVLPDGSRVLFSVDSVQRGELAALSDEDRAARRSEYTRRWSSDGLQAYLADLKARAEVQVFKDRLQ